MAYNTKAILTDLNGKPIPQYFDVAADGYAPLTRAELWEDIETQLAAILAKIIAAPATEATLAALLANTSTTLYGATTATRPAANTVPAGTVFVAVTSPLGITMSNGSAWVVV